MRRPPNLPETRTCAGRSIAQLIAWRIFAFARGWPAKAVESPVRRHGGRLHEEAALVDAELVGERTGGRGRHDGLEVGLAGLDLQDALVLVTADRHDDPVRIGRAAALVVLVPVEDDRAADLTARDVVRPGTDDRVHVLLGVRSRRVGRGEPVHRERRDERRERLRQLDRELVALRREAADLLRLPVVEGLCALHRREDGDTAEARRRGIAHLRAQEPLERVDEPLARDGLAVRRLVARAEGEDVRLPVLRHDRLTRRGLGIDALAQRASLLRVLHEVVHRRPQELRAPCVVALLRVDVLVVAERVVVPQRAALRGGRCGPTCQRACDEQRRRECGHHCRQHELPRHRTPFLVRCTRPQTGPDSYDFHGCRRHEMKKVGS